MFSVNILLLWIWMCSYIGDGAPGKYYMVKLKEDEQLTDKKYDLFVGYLRQEKSSESLILMFTFHWN